MLYTIHINLLNKLSQSKKCLDSRIHDPLVLNTETKFEQWHAHRNNIPNAK